MRTSIFCSTIVCFAASLSAAPKLSLSEKGVGIDAGVAGKYTLSVPGLRISDKDYTGEKPVTELKNGVLLGKYPSGAEIRISLADQNKRVVAAYSSLPENAKAFVFQTHIPIRNSAGGSYAIGDKAPSFFPEVKDKQILSDGAAGHFTVLDPSGAGYRISMPADYQQVQDNRVFNWATFVHNYNYSIAAHKGQNTVEFKISAPNIAAPAAAVADGAATKSFVVDRYGQSARKDYAEKVKSDDELKADLEKEKSDPPRSGPELDTYGGLAGSGAQYGLKKTGFFHIEKVGERQILVTPEGNAFFQLGVCGIASTDDFTTVKGREKIYEWLPKPGTEFDSAWRENKPEWGVFSFYIANWIRKHGRPFTIEEWTGQAVDRLRRWGFNSAGAFSKNTEAMRSRNFPTVSFLPLGKGGGVTVLPDKIGAAELMDPFAPGTEEALEKKFAKGVAAKANDPLLIGYFLGNEQHFEILPKKIPSYKASQVAAKGRLVQMLQDKYGDIAKFNAAWNPAKPLADFEAAKEEPLFVRTEAAAADVQKFYELYLDTYFAMVNRLFRKYDSNHLLIGNRLTPGTANNETAVRIAGKYVDVESVNYYTYPMEERFLRQVHEWSGGRPIILSEWYYSSSDQGLGTGKEVKDQKDRGMAYRNYVENAAALPFVVGSQWFIYTDQSITGRFFEGFNGEGNNTGFVNVADRPYADLVSAARETHARIYDVMFGKAPAFVFNDPRFDSKGGGGGNRVVAIPKALPGLKFDGTTTNWPGRPAEPIESSRIAHGTENSKLRGDFRLCWDEKELHFLIQVKDPTPGLNDHKEPSLWAADAVELFIGAKDLNQKGSMIFSDRQILLGAGKEPKLHVADHPEESPKCKVLVVQEVSGDGYVLQASIPWSVIGIEPKAGAELLFDVAIDNSDDGRARKQQLVWNGTSKNSGDRGAWGRARIVEN